MTRKQIPYARQSITEEDIAAVEKVLRSPWLTTGPAIDEFEEKIAAYCGGRYATAVSSATSALHIAYLAAGLSPGDLLWTSPNTFVASANAALYCGAAVDFVDIDPETYNMSVSHLAAKLEQADRQGRLPKVVVPVHFAGQPCAMDEIWTLAQKYGFTVIEDAAHALGAVFNGDKIGACRYSHMAVFSFHPVKIITTGEGGLVMTNDPLLHKRLRLYRSHGITRSPEEMTHESHGPWYYQQLELGYNFRITDMQAALGSSQLARLDRFIARRAEIAGNYTRALAGMPVTTPYQHAKGRSAWHLYVIKLAEGLQVNRRQAFDGLRQRGIGVNVHYIPVHTQPYYRKKFGFKTDSFPNAQAYYEACLSLPMYFELTDEEQNYTIRCLQEILQA